MASKGKQPTKVLPPKLLQNIKTNTIRNQKKFVLIERVGFIYCWYFYFLVGLTDFFTSCRRVSYFQIHFNSVKISAAFIVYRSLLTGENKLNENLPC